MRHGIKKLRVNLSFSEGQQVHVGLLADHAGDIRFEYDSEFIAAGLEISPFRLPLGRSTWKGTPELFGGLPGVMDDSLPDGWGRLLMDRQFLRAGVNPATLSQLDRLAYLGSRTMGALTYHPPANECTDNQGLDLDLLAQQSEDVLSGDAPQVLEQLIRVGGSSGGARPKALVGIRGDTIITGDGPLPADFEPWLVKFRGHRDPPDTGAIEYVYSLMARKAGLEMSPCRLLKTAGGARFFATRRFDRRATGRLHSHTLANFLHKNFRQPAFDYEHLLRVALRLTQTRAAVHHCYRHMLFNVLAWNRDDHAKNFGFLMDPEGQWRTSPSYDLVFSEGYRELHFTTIAGEGAEPTRQHFERLATLVDLGRRECKTIEDAVRSALGEWPTLAKEHEISTETIERIAVYHARAAKAVDGPN